MIAVLPLLEWGGWFNREARNADPPKREHYKQQNMGTDGGGKGVVLQGLEGTQKTLLQSIRFFPRNPSQSLGNCGFRREKKLEQDRRPGGGRQMMNEIAPDKF